MRVLAVSVHPDDETLGCGGTLLKHAAQGDELFWLVVTVAHEPHWTAGSIERRASEVSQVAKAYGMNDTYKLNLPTTLLETLPQGEIIEGIRDVLAEVKPDTVYLVHGGDVHGDHRAAFHAALSVLKAFYMKQLGVTRVLSYETLSSTEAAPAQAHTAFLPTVYNDVSPHLDRKLDIMAMYETETHPDPMPRGPGAIRALARYRGAAIGVEYAEAFMLIREVL